jgi:hypothetical protein
MPETGGAESSASGAAPQDGCKWLRNHEGGGGDRPGRGSGVPIRSLAVPSGALKRPGGPAPHARRNRHSIQQLARMAAT